MSKITTYNSTSNAILKKTHPIDSKSFSLIDFLHAFEPYYVLTIVMIGLVGNSISFLLFILTKLK